MNTRYSCQFLVLKDLKGNCNLNYNHLMSLFPLHRSKYESLYLNFTKLLDSSRVTLTLTVQPRLTEPGYVLVVPCQGLFAAAVQSSSARHPPEGVDVGAGVEVGPPQQAHSAEALLGWEMKETQLRSVHTEQVSSCVASTHLLADTCKRKGSCPDPILNERESESQNSQRIFLWK